MDIEVDNQEQATACESLGMEFWRGKWSRWNPSKVASRYSDQFHQRQIGWQPGTKQKTLSLRLQPESLPSESNIVSTIQPHTWITSKLRYAPTKCVVTWGTAGAAIIPKCRRTTRRGCHVKVRTKQKKTMWRLLNVDGISLKQVALLEKEVILRSQGTLCNDAPN